jgi:hypothetical protein
MAAGRRLRLTRGRALAVATAAVLGAATVAARAQSDVLSVAEWEALPATTVRLPVLVRDVSGTLLDEGAGAGLEIQGYAFRVNFAPADAVDTIDFQLAGVTAGHNPIFPIVQIFTDHVVVLMSFDETIDPLVFGLDAPAPGDVVGELVIGLDPAYGLGTLVTFVLEEANAALVNGSATLSETVANGHLVLADGSLLLDDEVFADGFESGDTGRWSSTVMP